MIVRWSVIWKKNPLQWCQSHFIFDWCKPIKVIFTLSEQHFEQNTMETGISVDCCKFLQFFRISCNQHWFALHCLAFLTTTALLYRSPAVSDSPPTSPMTRHICITYSGCQGEESHHPTDCSCSSDGAALHHTSQIQHQRREDGSYHRGRSTGKALPQSWRIPAEEKWAWWPAVISA